MVEWLSVIIASKIRQCLTSGWHCLYKRARGPAPFLSSIGFLIITSGLFSSFVSSVWASSDSSQEIRNCIKQGNNYLTHNCFQQAINEYERCLQLDPDNSCARSNIVLAHNNWGIIYFKEGKYELAKQQWQTALRLSPNDRKAKYNLVLCQQAMLKSGKQLGLSGEQKLESSEIKEKPNASAIVILDPAKLEHPANQKPEEIDKNRSETVIEKKVTGEDKASAEQTDSHNNQDSAKAISPEAPLPKYDQPDTESGAKILPHKQAEGEALPQIDESINRLEIKIYGQVKAENSVLQRLERMELDSFGKVSNAPITERISRLKRLFSVND